jgi:class 3 adenylate cyclase
MLDSSLKSDLIEIIAENFNPDQMDEIGCLLMKKYCAHELLGMGHHITVPKRKASAVLVDHCLDRNCVDKLLEFLIETDGGTVMGKKVTIENLELFLSKLARTGLVYDFKKRKLKKAGDEVSELPNWGSLRDGKKYEMSIVSIDIVGNSKLVSEYGMKKMEKLYYRFWSFLRRLLEVYDGRMWNWAGDGGILAFTFKDHALRAVQCALEIQVLLPIFNTDPNRPIQEDISVRLGIDHGTVKFCTDTGRIVSETINYAAHLEKAYTEPGTVSISAELYEKLPSKLAGFFDPKGEFEGKKVYVSSLHAESN